MRRSLIIVFSLLILGLSPAPALAVPRVGPSEDCGVRVNRPHFSRQYGEVHTRIESFCVVPAMANTVS
ncbi:hypothetical protein, partial [Actinomycetospora sp.]|uniref:hypothetical protein n=1 Tax=Actinomycetospora sp. TaxID=1872135 RepID=UPI002F42CA66